MYFPRRSDEKDTDYGRRITAMFQSVARSQMDFKRREKENWRFYMGIKNWQWDEAAVNFLLEEGRPVHTFNVVQGAVNTHVGILRRNPLGTRFSAPDGAEGTDSLNLAQVLFDYDHDRGKWSFEEAMFLLGGVVFRGVAQHIPDFRHSKFGNPGWRAIDPTTVWVEDSWTSYDPRECNYLFRVAWKTPEEIKALIPNSRNVDLIHALQTYKQGTPELETLQEDLNDAYGEWCQNGKYKIIECHYLVPKTKKEYWDKDTNSLVDIKDESLGEMAVAAGKYRCLEYQEKTSMVVSVAPALGYMLISEGKYPIQAGRLPFDIWSAHSVMGEPLTVIDIMKDAQEVYNKRQSSLSLHFASQANGTKLGDVSFFPEPAMRRKAEENINAPGIIWVDSNGRDPRHAITPVMNNAMPQGLFDDSMQLLNFMDRVSAMSSAAGVSQSGTPGANAQHYSALLSSALAPFELQHASLRAVYEARAEMYIESAKVMYGRVPRRIRNPGGGSVMLNKLVFNGSDWTRENSISEIERYDYVVEPAPTGDNKRREALESTVQQMQFTTNPLLKAILEVQAFEYRDDIPHSMKKQAKEGAEMYVQLVNMQVQTQIAQMQASLQQMQQPQQEAPPDANDIAGGAGMGSLPASDGLAGTAEANNNLQAHPSDLF